MIDWKKYARFKTIQISEWNDKYEKDAWEIIQFFVEDHTNSYSNVQQGETYTISTGTTITIPIATQNHSNYTMEKFLIGQHKTHDVLFKKET